MFYKKELRKYLELDTLRFISVTLVVGHHLFSQSNFFTQWCYHFGWVGVDIFFTLSGFLITKLLLREISQTGTINFKKFITKRMLRLWPSWIIALFFSFSLVYYFGRTNLELKNELFSKFPHYILHFANYSHAFFGKIHTLFSHYWSLAVEEHFYLMWPLTLLMITKYPRFRILGFCIMLVTPYLFRVWHLSNGAEEVVVTFSTHTRLDSLAWGCLLAFYHSRIKQISTLKEVFLSVLMFSLFYISLYFLVKNSQISPWLSELGRTLISIATCILIHISLTGHRYGVRKLLQFEFLSWLGIMSYGVYLFHFHTNTLLFGFLQNKLNIQSDFLIMLLSFSLPYFPAILAYYFVDKKFQKLKR